MLDVHHRVDEARDAAVEEVDDELARRGGAAVAGAERERREHDRERQSLGRGAQHLVLGDVLGALVRAEEVRDVGVGPLVGRRRARGVVDPEHADGAGVHHALAACRAHRGEDVECASDVHLREPARVARPEGVDGREVEDEACAFAQVAHGARRRADRGPGARDRPRRPRPPPRGRRGCARRRSARPRRRREHRARAPRA